MKILHTSDWHLGRKLEGRDRYREQEEILSEIAQIARDRDCKIVMVAGDVFDVSTPPAQAEGLFYRALEDLSGEGRLVLVVAGNHDDPDRVACASCILEHRNVLVASPEGFREGLNLQNFRVAAQSRYTLLLEGYGELVNVTCLCYPYNYAAENSADRSYTDNLRGLLRTDVTGGRKILLSHLFAAGAQVSGEERCIEVGGLRVADASLFEDYDYVALGHIHRHQRVKNGCYSGSIAQYAFDERQDKGVVLYDTLENDFEFLPLQSGRKLVRIRAEGVDLGMAELNAHPGDYVELTLKLNRPLSFSENKLLKAFDNLAALRIELEEAGTEARQYRNLRPEQLFAAFWEKRYGRGPGPEILDEFLSLYYEREGEPESDSLSEAAAALSGEEAR